MLKKEVIEPQVPLRLPCYALARLTKSRFDSTLRIKPHLNLTWMAWQAVCARSRDTFTAR